MGRASYGINPVTFRGMSAVGGNKKMALTIARMHISIGGPLHKWMPVAMFEDGGDPEEPREPVGMVILEEEHFLEGMYHLFPIEAAMDHGDRAPASVNDELVVLLRHCLTAFQRMGADDAVKPIQVVFDKYGL